MSLRVSANWRRDDFTLEVDLDLPTEGVTALFGRSGCGKTTLLRIIAGLERAPGAIVRFGEQVWQQDGHFLPPEKRRVGLVFQEHSLLPHLNVRDNLLYGWRRTPPDQRRLQLEEVTQMLAITDLLDRRLDQLSGGQRQRVSLGRALLCSPHLLLLDEPMAALDSQTRQEIMPFLSRLSQQAGVPMLLVSHAPDEVQRLADHVVFLRNGQAEAPCRLQEALSDVHSPLFVDTGPASVLYGKLEAGETAGWARLHSGEVSLQIPAREGAWPEAGGSGQGRTRLRVLARDVSIALSEPQDISIQNHLQARIESLQSPEAGHSLVRTRLADGQHLLAEITSASAQRLQLKAGLPVWVLIKAAALVNGPAPEA